MCASSRRTGPSQGTGSSVLRAPWKEPSAAAADGRFGSCMGLEAVVRLRHLPLFDVPVFYEGFVRAIAEELPWVEIVIDRFHVARAYRDCADTVRKKELKRLKSQLPAAEYAEITGAKIEAAYHLREDLTELFERTIRRWEPRRRFGPGVSGCVPADWLSSRAFWARSIGGWMKSRTTSEVGRPAGLSRASTTA